MTTQRLDLLSLFQPNAGCTDLMYTPHGDITIDSNLDNTYETDGLVPYEFAKPKLVSPFDRCWVRGLMALGMGYAFGGFMALFLNAFQNPIPYELQDQLSTKQQLIYSYKDLVRNMKRMGKQMALIGGLYGTIECCIERTRARQDIKNHIATGCVTGGLLAAPTGSAFAMCTGCAGFAAFSWVIEKYMMAEHFPNEMEDENTRLYQQLTLDLL